MFEVIKRVVLGKQKQSNKINDAVISMIQKSMDSKHLESNKEAQVVDYIVELMNTYMRTYDAMTETDRMILALIIGTENMKIGRSGNCIVRYRQLNKTSPKLIFEYVPLSDAEAFTNETPITTEVYWDTTEIKPVMDESHAGALQSNYANPIIERVNRIRDTLLPSVTEEVKMQYPDNEYAQCLQVAYNYYKSN